jgi:hypothetical protein
MRTEEVNIYKFSELSLKVQEEVLDHNRELAYYDDWHEWIVSDFIESKPKWLDIEAKDIQWDDRFNMDISNKLSVDIQKYLEKTYPDRWRLMEPFQMMMMMEGMGGIDFDMLDYPTIDDDDLQDSIRDREDYLTNTEEYVNRVSQKIKEQIESILENIHIEIESLIKDLSKELEAAYDDLGSDEQVRDMIEANEWEFYKDGRRYLG